MTEDQRKQPWVERCARHIQRRHMMAPPEALELAMEMHAALAGTGCPERVADELFSGCEAL